MELAIDRHIVFGQGVQGGLSGCPRCSADTHEFIFRGTGQHAVWVIKSLQGFLLGLPLLVLGHGGDLVKIVPGFDVTRLQSDRVILFPVKEPVLIVVLDLLLQLFELMVPQLVP